MGETFYETLKELSKVARDCIKTVPVLVLQVEFRFSLLVVDILVELLEVGSER